MKAKKTGKAPDAGREQTEARFVALGLLLDKLDVIGSELAALGVGGADHLGEVWRETHERFVCVARDVARTRCEAK